MASELLGRRHLAEVDPLQSREIGSVAAVRAKFESSSVQPGDPTSHSVLVRFPSSFGERRESVRQPTREVRHGRRSTDAAPSARTEVGLSVSSDSAAPAPPPARPGRPSRGRIGFIVLLYNRGRASSLPTPVAPSLVHAPSAPRCVGTRHALDEFPEHALASPRARLDRPGFLYTRFAPFGEGRSTEQDRRTLRGTKPRPALSESQSDQLAPHPRDAIDWTSKCLSKCERQAPSRARTCRDADTPMTVWDETKTRA
jgi:hypothetical protein